LEVILMKTLRILKSAGILLVLAAALLLPGCRRQDDDLIRIGMIFPFSGMNADQGDFNRNGAELARDRINAAGGIHSLGGRQIELVFYDNQSSSDMSRVVAERLLFEHPEIVAVHGAAASAFVLPMLATFERARMPFLTAQTAQTITGQGYQYVFAFAAQSPQFAATQVAMLDWLNANFGLGITRVGLVYEDSEWGITNSQAARDVIQRHPNLTLVFDQSYQAAVADLSPIVLGLMNAGAEVVFPTSYTQDAMLLFNTMLQFEYSPLIVGGGAGFLYPVFADALGDLVEGVLSVASHNYDARTILDNPALVGISQEYEARFGEIMPEQAVSAFNAVYLIAQALENTGTTDRTRLRDELRRLTISTLTPGGPLNFDHTGWNQNGTAVMIQWQRDATGNFRPRTVYPPSEAAVEFQLTDMLRQRIN
jgi:branched-chain amino acid transport system substrate-binding protein